MDTNHSNFAYSPYPQGSQQQPLAPQFKPEQQSSSHNVNSPYANLSAQQAHQQSPQQPSPQHATLPPLQAQQNNGGYSFGALSYQQPGSQSQTPNNAHAPNGQSVYNQAAAMMPPSPYSHAYPMSQPMSQSMMYPPLTPTTLPPSNGMSGLPAIRPMPAGGNGAGAHGLAGMNGHAGQLAAHQSTFLQSDDQPTHVVGQQGRRGILPSAPGRPNPPAHGAAGTKSLIPQKDADGKFPCPHCNKTYLHAKHLKRHLLRHTGDRPYMCHLCKDTFSRSDILKRHFQKCSLRRGNPTGANHLAHQRRNTNSNNRLSISAQDGPIGLANLQEVTGQPPYGSNNSPTVSGDMSARSSRANSLITPGALVQRNNLAGLGILQHNPANGNVNGSSAGYQPNLGAYAAMQHSTPDGAHMPVTYPSFDALYPTSDQPKQISSPAPMSLQYSNSNISTTPVHMTPNGNHLPRSRGDVAAAAPAEYAGQHNPKVDPELNHPDPDFYTDPQLRHGPA